MKNGKILTMVLAFLLGSLFQIKYVYSMDLTSFQEKDQMNSTYEIDSLKITDRKIIGQTTSVDENGKIEYLNVYDGTTGYEDNPKLRRVETANMVNFNCSKAGVTTTFIDYYTGQEGYLSKASAADAAYLGMENGKVKFMISGVVGLVDPNLVEIVPQGTYYSSNYEVNSKGLLYHYISNNVNALDNSHGQDANYIYVGEAPSYLSKEVEYYSYDGHYFYDDYNKMINDYKNNVRTHSINSSNPYYFYYQYLPLRSKTNYTAQEITTYLNNKSNSQKSKLNNTGTYFIDYQNKFGVNALLAASFAALESNWGKGDPKYPDTNIVQTKNNLFGLNAVDNNPGGNADSFKTVEDCIYNFTSSWMSKRYLNPKYTTLYRGGFFGNKGSGIFGKYSSDPYEGEKCASIAANMDAGISNKDKNYYTLGIKDSSSLTYTSLNVRSQANTNSSIYYTTIKNPCYSFVIKKKTAENGFYIVQNELANTDNTYDFYNNAYVSGKYVNIVNIGNDINDYKTGWQKKDNKWFYIDENGKYHTGWLCLDHKWYYFNSNGEMQTGWFKYYGNWYYLDQSGAMVTGLQSIGNELCYFDANGIMQRGWRKAGDKWYYFNASGYAYKGWFKYYGNWYYLDQSGAMVTGLQTIGNELCYFDENGIMQRGWRKAGDKWYYFNASGYAYKGWFKYYGNWYYLDQSGAMVTGWIKLGNTWYYLNSSGAMVTGSVSINGIIYNFNSSGAWIS